MDELFLLVDAERLFQQKMDTSGFVFFFAVHWMELPTRDQAIYCFVRKWKLFRELNKKTRISTLIPRFWFYSALVAWHPQWQCVPEN